MHGDYTTLKTGEVRQDPIHVIDNVRFQPLPRVWVQRKRVSTLPH